MIKPRVIRIITPGPPGPAGDGITMTGPAVLGRATGTGPAVSLPLGPGLSIVDGALVSSGGTTNLSYDPVTQTLASSSGDDAILPEATTTTAGLMSAAGQTRLEQLGADDAPSFAGLTITGVDPVLIPHIHGDIAGSLYFHVKNASGSELARGTAVRVVGAVGDTTTLEVAAASPDNLPAVGCLDETLASNGFGHAVIVGEITGINSAALGPSHTPVYVGAGGALTATKPAAGVQRVATVGRSHATTGTLVVQLGQTAADLGFSAAGIAVGRAVDAAAQRTALGINGVQTFIQPTAPTTGQLAGATSYAWWDTSGGNLTLWIEDGV